MYDVAILGAGVIGCSLAYELSRYNLKVLLLDKENDVSLGASRANTAIVHGGYDPEPDSLMGKLNVKGAKKCMEMVKTLDVEFRKTGSLVVGFDENDRKTVEMLYERGLANGCEGLEIWDGERCREHEPFLSKEVTCALWIPESGVINPWELTTAYAEVAVREGVELKLNSEVIDLQKHDDHYHIKCKDQEYKARFVVNCCGANSDRIHNLVAKPEFKITPTKGEYFLLDRAVGELVNSVIFQCPSKVGKGILVSPTVHLNTLVGPDAQVVEDNEDTSVSQKGLDYVELHAKRSIPNLNLRYNIRNYAGVRANSDYGDFFVKISAPHFLDMAAIKSPGLTCAPVLAEYGVKLLSDAGLELHEKSNWNGERKITRFKMLSDEERAQKVAENPLYGRIICRCETITEGEIVDAIHRGITPCSLDGVKRRCGTGMGRCQGGFCGPRIVEILARETGKKPEDILQDKAGSYILIGDTKVNPTTDEAISETISPETTAAQSEHN